MAAHTADGRSGNYASNEHASPLEIKATVQDGPVGIRYISGQNRAVLAKQTILSR